MRVSYLFWFCLYVFPGVFLHSRVTGACPVTTDFIMRVNMRTTTTTTKTRLVRVRRNSTRLQSNMGCEGGCTTIHAHKEGQHRVEDAEDGMREPARGD